MQLHSLPGGSFFIVANFFIKVKRGIKAFFTEKNPAIIKKRGAVMKKLGLIGLFAILVCAVGHVVYAVQEYGTVLTAVPLGMRIAFVSLFWLLVLLIGAAVYLFVLKRKGK